MTRLSFLRLLGLMPATRYGTMGQAHRRPDQLSDPPPSAVAPTQSAGVPIRTRQVVIFGTGPNTGLFVYNGQPVNGNPPIFWVVAPGVTKDPFNNTLPANVLLGVGVPGGIGLQVDQSGNLTLSGTGSSTEFLPAANLPFSLTAALSGVMQAVGLFSTADGNQAQAGVISGIVLGTGTAAKMGTLITSPYGSTGMGLLLQAVNDGATDTANATFGTVVTQGGTLTFTPLLAVLPGALIQYTGASQITVVTKTTGSGTIPIPVGVTVAKAECWGSGATGGGGDASSTCGSGGGGGEYAAEPNLAVPSGGTVAFVVGAGGAAATGHVNGNDGASSTLTGTSVTVTAHGGTHGVSTPPSSPQPGGLGGTGSTNTTHFNGGQGGSSDTGGDGGGGGSSAGTAAAGNPGGNGTGHSGGAGGAAPAGGGSGGAGGTPPANGVAGHAPGGASGGAAATLSGNSTSPAAPSGQARLTYASGTPAILASVANAAGTDQFGTGFSKGTLLSTPAQWGFPVASQLLADGTVMLGEQATPAVSATGPKAYGNTTGHLGVVSDSLHGDSNNYDTERLSKFLAADTPVAISTNVTLFSKAVAVGTYAIDGIIKGVQGATAVAQGVQFNGPTVTFNDIYIESNAVANTSVTDSDLTGALPVAHSTPAWGNGVTFYVRFRGILTFSAAGTFTVVGQGAATGAWTAKAASLFSLYPVVAT